MSSKRHVIRLSTPVLILAIGTCLALANCGGGGSSSTAAGESVPSGSRHSASASSGNSSGGNSSAACAAFTTAYHKFLTGYTPPQSQTGTDETPLQALSDAVTKITAAGQLQRDLSNLGIDAGLIATGSTEGGQTTPPSAFYSDLQAVGKDCGTTLSKPLASLVREG